MPNRDDYISESSRRLVEERADKRCEYCLIYEEDTYIGCEIDHIISIKHGGKTTIPI
jgi:5-methylcytosine-specific restriction endonuclease McrA